MAIPKPAARAPAADGTAGRILDVAERLVQERGFNAFSYAHIAPELGITKASLHYHFASKADLGAALISRYAERFATALAAIDDTESDPCRKLHRYADLYASVLENGRMCLCGMLAADYATLPAEMRSAVSRFFDDNERWLASVLEAGQAAGEMSLEVSPEAAAQLMVGTLEGAMLVARSRGSAARLRSVADLLLTSLGVRSPASA